MKWAFTAWLVMGSPVPWWIALPISPLVLFVFSCVELAQADVERQRSAG